MNGPDPGNTIIPPHVSKTPTQMHTQSVRGGDYITHKNFVNGRITKFDTVCHGNMRNKGPRFSIFWSLGVEYGEV